jgi:hypothetical protein
VNLANNTLTVTVYNISECFNKRKIIKEPLTCCYLRREKKQLNSKAIFYRPSRSGPEYYTWLVFTASPMNSRSITRSALRNRDTASANTRLKQLNPDNVGNLTFTWLVLKLHATCCNNTLACLNHTRACLKHTCECENDTRACQNYTWHSIALCVCKS